MGEKGVGEGEEVRGKGRREGKTCRQATGTHNDAQADGHKDRQGSRQMDTKSFACDSLKAPLGSGSVGLLMASMA